MVNYNFIFYGLQYTWGYIKRYEWFKQFTKYIVTDIYV